MTWSTVNGWFFHGFPGGKKTHGYRKKCLEKSHSFGQITASLHKRFIAPKWWYSGDLAQIHSSKWFVPSSPFTIEILSGWRRMELTYLRKKRFARSLWTAVLPGSFVDLKWNLPFWIHPPNNGKIATMFQGIPQDIATWTLPLPKRTFWTAGRYSRELWMGWSLSAINGYNSGRMHPWGSWSV